MLLMYSHLAITGVWVCVMYGVHSISVHTFMVTWMGLNMCSNVNIFINADLKRSLICTAIRIIMEAYSSHAVYVGECIPLTAHFEPTVLLLVTLDIMHVLFVTRPSNVIRI
jgi:hypothetical protein